VPWAKRNCKKLKNFSHVNHIQSLTKKMTEINADADQLIALDHAKYNYYWTFLERSNNGDNNYLAQGLKVRMNKYKQVSDVIYLTQRELVKIIIFVYRMNPLAKGKELYWAFEDADSSFEVDICTEDLMFYVEFISFMASNHTIDETSPNTPSFNAMLEEMLMDLNDFKSRFADDLPIVEKIDKIKCEIASIINMFDLSKRVSEEIMMDLCRSERIYHILITERKMNENNVTPNVRRVIQNSDLNRYMMGFI
jgi:hypothetical protein